jgi:carboxyl-terminal processing protease
MKSSGLRVLVRNTLLKLAALVCLFGAPAFSQTTVTVVEYYNKEINAYFLTGRSAEQSLLDSAGDFQRTGMTFQAASANGADPSLSVCRYRIVVNSAAGTYSHFYGLKSDCDRIAASGLSNFFNEGLDFAIERINNAAACPASSPVGVFRTLRTGTQISTPNHRYTVSADSYQDMISQGWTGEGVVFCVKSATDITPRPTFAASSLSSNFCAVPRTGTDPFTGARYTDRQGTLDTEKSWLRSWIDETYLWYREVPNNLNAASYSTAVSYFNALKTPAVTATGSTKDKFHFTYDTNTWNALSSGSASVGYGVEWAAISSAPPRQWIAAIVAPGSPAAAAGLLRGDSIVAIDGTNFSSGNATNLNNGLFPSVVGERHTFRVLAAGASTARDLTLTAGNVAEVPVQNVKTITASNGDRIGYMLFTSHIATAESYLFDAITTLKQQAVTDLVLDLRYNGGGYLDVAAELAYMIAGPAITSGKTFERLAFNEKNPFGFSSADLITPFHATTQGFSMASGRALPSLNLNRVYVLTSPDTCSASEAIINGLRGVGVNVVTVGSTTCGKPYGFFATDNCGTTYFAIQFVGVNNLGLGDYADGFAASCAASDDFSKPLGDASEGQLATALRLRATGICSPNAVNTNAAKRILHADDADATRDPRATFRQQRILGRLR